MPRPPPAGELDCPPALCSAGVSHAWSLFDPSSYELLDLSWFDDAYFEKYGPDLTARLVRYVRANRSQFIES